MFGKLAGPDDLQRLANRRPFVAKGSAAQRQQVDVAKLLLERDEFRLVPHLQTQAIGEGAGIFVAGVLTVAQFSFWGNYIPLVFPVHLRGTGESFAANIGGRVLGTAAAWLTLTLSASDKPDPARVALVGACVAGAYALVGAVLTQFLPEPKPEDLKE